MTWKLSEVAKAIGGQLKNASNELVIEGVQFDSRKLTEGDLFIPLVAERDGHDFIQSALDNGAVAALWSEAVEKVPEGFPVILVDDTFQGLVNFAKWHLQEVNPIKVAITGSNGKTTTKDMVAAVLSEKYRTHKTTGNFNNDIGVPITILNMPHDSEVAVIEMGMDKPGEISMLSNLVEPDIAIITMIGESHIEFFGSREKISEAKLEILEGLKEDGLFIANGDEPLLQSALANVPNAKTFGLEETNDIFSTDIHTEKRQTSFKVNIDPEKTITIPTPGRYNVNNALSSLLVGLELGMTLDQAAKGLQGFQLTKNRLEWLEGINGASVLNDAYNASPSSMKAVLDYYSTLDVEGQKIAVLGDIRELGHLSEELHLSIAKSIDPELIDVVILYGQEMKVLYNKLLSQFEESNLLHFEGNKTALVEKLQSIMNENDTVLLKSSLGTDLLSVVDKIKID